MKLPSILSEEQYSSCRLCPRQCGVDRTALQGGGTQSGSRLGYCQCTDHIMVARAALHQWEEPCISGADLSGGSGAVFFSGCTLGCCFCQNYSISHGHFGKEITVRQLADIFLRLQDEGAYNINLVTATQYLPSVVKALDLVRNRLTIPIVYNCGGYERPEIVRALAGYVDIWLPDLKYFDPSLSARCSQARDYFTYASLAIPQMIAQTGAPVMDEHGLLRSGVIVRHMVLPGARADSIILLHWMKDNLPEGKWLLSLMSQYTPAGETSADEAATGKTAAGEAVADEAATEETAAGEKAASKAIIDKSAAGKTAATAPLRTEALANGAVRRYPDLTRRITTFEYESVLNTAIDLGLTAGYMQQKSSAKEEYTPPFDLTGV